MIIVSQSYVPYTPFRLFSVTYGDTLRHSGELCLSNMARIKFVGRGGARRLKVEKELVIVQQDAQNDSDVNEADPNVQLIAKLQKGLKLFREIAGDSDAVGLQVYVLYTFSRVVIITALSAHDRLM